MRWQTYEPWRGETKSSCGFPTCHFRRFSELRSINIFSQALVSRFYRRSALTVQSDYVGNHRTACHRRQQQQWCCSFLSISRVYTWIIFLVMREFCSTQVVFFFYLLYRLKWFYKIFANIAAQIRISVYSRSSSYHLLQIASSDWTSFKHRHTHMS